MLEPDFMSSLTLFEYYMEDILQDILYSRPELEDYFKENQPYE